MTQHRHGPGGLRSGRRPRGPRTVAAADFRFALFLALALAVAACSTPHHGAAAIRSAATTSTAPGGAGGAGGAGSAAGRGQSGAAISHSSVSAGQAGSQGQSNAAGTQGQSGQGGGHGQIVVAGKTLVFSHGVSNGEIEIGIPWIDTAAGKAALASIGGAGATLGDSKAQAQAVVDYVNSHGGIDGLKVKPVFYQINVPNSTHASGRAQEAQAECAAWEQDHHAFAFLVVLAPDDVHLACSQATHTPVISAAAITSLTVDEVLSSQMRNLIYNPSGLLADQRERTIVDRMVTTGVMTPKSKVGVLFDANSAVSRRSAARTLVPELNRRNIRVVSQIGISDCLDAPYGTYVLQLRQAGVTDVYLSAGNCGAAPVILFGRAADSQGWYPHIILGSDEAPGGMPGTQSEKIVEQMHGAGWQPHYDVQYTTTKPVSPTDALCGQIMKGAGEPEYDSFDMATGYCEGLLFLQAALRNSTAITPDGLAAGAEALRNTWPGVLTPHSDFSGGYHDAADAIQPFAYDRSCKCMKYVGVAVPSH